MSRNDDFNIIDLTENLEKNTEELIREVQTESRSTRELDRDMYGNSRRELNTDMYGNSRQELNTDMYGSSRRELNTDMYEARRNSDADKYRAERKQPDAETYGSQNRNNGASEYPGRERNVSGRSRVEGRNYDNRNAGEEDMSGRKRGSSSEKDRGKRKSSRLERKLKRKLIKIIIVVAVLFAAVYGMVYSVVSKTNYEELETDYVRPSDVETVSGVKNILLIGTDARSTDEDGRSDSMIILSINSKKNKIVMTSVLRDSYVEIPGHGSNRINAAYSYGQEDLLIQTIEQNFKIPIDAYAKVDFFSFIDIVDAVGGVELDLSQEEVEWVNAYLNETNELLGKEFGDGYLTSPGVQTLTGKQALSYARIRYIGTDFGRTERQRKILNAVADKVKSNPASVSKLAGSILPSVTTNMKDSELTLLVMKSVLYLGCDMEQFCIPADNTWKNATISGMSVLEVDFEANRQAFKEAVYE